MPVVEMELLRTSDARDWRARLMARIGETAFDSHIDSWPSSHEQLGDLIILRRLDRSVEGYAGEIAGAMLESLPRMRSVLRDDGVISELRVRNLSPLAVREPSGAIRLTEGEPVSTRTEVREHGASIVIDPSRAYFSSKLAGERRLTVAAAEALSARLGRPLSVCDPYCGVGPALVHLLRSPGLVCDLLACDLNPDAMEMLEENLGRANSGRNTIPSKIAIRTADARTLADDLDLRERFDLLLVNLPHDALDHLSHLLPLLRRDCPTVVRGWCVLEDDAIPEANARLQSILPPLDDASEEALLLTSRKGYSSTQSLCRFDAVLAAPVQ